MLSVWLIAVRRSRPQPDRMRHGGRVPGRGLATRSLPCSLCSWPFSMPRSLTRVSERTSLESQSSRCSSLPFEPAQPKESSASYVIGRGDRQHRACQICARTGAPAPHRLPGSSFVRVQGLRQTRQRRESRAVQSAEGVVAHHQYVHPRGAERQWQATEGVGWHPRTERGKHPDQSSGAGRRFEDPRCLNTLL